MPEAELRVLGPVEVVGPAGAAVLPGSRQRALVGLLALRPGTVLGRDSLIDALWGEDPPRTALKTLYSHITRVRQAMAACGLPDLLSTREPGYALLVDADQVDALRFEACVRQARDTQPAVAAERLRTGLALWRGDAFADAALAGWGGAEVDRLHEARLAATEDFWQAELAVGRHGTAALELEPLVARHPYRERLVGLLMLARYRSGRHAEALDAYHRLRTQLADELGVDPGPELQRRYAAILRHEPDLDSPASAAPAPPRPAQLPAPVGHFTGRAPELDRMTASGARIVAISGPAGMGKTALALHWAHRVKDRFDGGQLFLDLRGHESTAALTAGQALPHLLRGLGVAPDRVPAEHSEQASLYRTLLHDKQMLIVLDNCGSVDDLLALVPGGERSLLLLTSRGQLTGLATRHAVQFVALDALGAGEALTLLTEVLGADRIDREPDAAAKLVDLCGGMPLALRIAAALLAARPMQPISELAAALATDNRLDALRIDGDSRSVRAVFASAYDAVSPAAARLFRLLGLHPGETVSAHLAAAVSPAAGPALAELVSAQLIAETSGRYRFHDLIRVYAAECARQDETPEARQETVDRILDWYLTIAEAANRTLDPRRDRVVPDPVHRPGGLPFPPSRDGILGFLDGERPNLLRLVRYAAEHDRHRVAWQLTYLLAGFFESRGHWMDRIELCRWSVRAAQRDGDTFAESLMCGSLGVALNATHRFAEALEPLNRSLDLARRIGDDRGQGNAYHNLARAYTELRRFDQAIEASEHAHRLYSATNQTVSTAISLNNIGDLYVRSGRLDLGFDHLDRALAMARQVGEPRIEAQIAISVGEAHLRHRDPRDAEEHFRHALEICAKIGAEQIAAETLRYLGLARLAQHDPAGATDLLQQALRASRKAADERLERDILEVLDTVRGGDLPPAAAPRSPHT